MKTRKTKILLIFLLYTLYSCSELKPGNGDFVVFKVDKGVNSTTNQLIQTKGHGQTWIRDSVGKYHVGDTLRLSYSVSGL